MIYPNVAVESFTIGDVRENFYLTSSRMVPYKKIHLIIEAFSNMPDRQLVVIGTGPQLQRCKALAGPNVRLLGYQSDAVLIRHLRGRGPVPSSSPPRRTSASRPWRRRLAARR